MTNEEELKQLVRDFFRILDIVEETDEGRPFRPTNITSCRAMDGAKLNDILKRMKELAGE
jgi:hypothetical protein